MSSTNGSDHEDNTFLQPPQVGGGEYHARLRSNIKLSPNAPRTVQRAAVLRKEAVEQVTRTIPNIDNELNHLDDETLASLAMDNSWSPSPKSSFDRPSTASLSTPCANENDSLSGIESPISTPTPSRPANFLFTPIGEAPAEALGTTEQQEKFRESVLVAMDFQSVKLPPPPHSSPPGIDDSEIQTYEDTGFVPPRALKKGRPTRASERDIQELFEKVNALFDAASEGTGQSVSTLVDRWNNLSKYGSKGSAWNTYQQYHQSNLEMERKRAGLPNGSASQCWESFKELPDFQELLETFVDLKFMENKTFAQRQKIFKKLVDSYRNLAHEASRNRVESFILLAGTSVNEDSNLAHIHTSTAMDTFIPEKLRMTSSEFTGLAKVHIYNKIGDAFVEELIATHGTPSARLASLVASLGEPSVHPKRPRQAGPIIVDLEEGDKKLDAPRNVDDDRALCKQEFFKLFQEHDLQVPLSARGNPSLPWSGLLDQLVTWGVQFTNWPTDVRFPSETLFDRKGNPCPSQGIKKLPGPDVRHLLSSFSDPTTRIKVNKRVSRQDLKDGFEPCIIKAAPVYGSKKNARRQFASGAIDEKGPEPLGPDAAITRVKKKTKGKGTAKPPPPQVEVLDITSSSPPRTRSRVRTLKTTKNRVDSPTSDDNNDDDDDAPLVRPKASSGTRNWESEDSDPDGLLNADPGDAEYNDQDEADWFAKKKSLEKPTGGNGKGKSKMVKSKPAAPPGRSVPIVSLPPPTHSFATPKKATGPATAASENERIRRAVEKFEKRAAMLSEGENEPVAKRPRTDGRESTPPPAPSAIAQPLSQPLPPPEARAAVLPHALSTQPPQIPEPSTTQTSKEGVAPNIPASLQVSRPSSTRPPGTGTPPIEVAVASSTNQASQPPSIGTGVAPPINPVSQTASKLDVPRLEASTAPLINLASRPPSIAPSVNTASKPPSTTQPANAPPPIRQPSRPLSKPSGTGAVPPLLTPRPPSAPLSGPGAQVPTARQRPPSRSSEAPSEGSNQRPLQARTTAPGRGARQPYPPHPTHYLQGPPPGGYYIGNARPVGPGGRGRSPMYPYPFERSLQVENGGWRGRGLMHQTLASRGRGRGGHGRIVRKDGPYPQENYQYGPQVEHGEGYHSEYLGDDWDHAEYPQITQVAPGHGGAGPSHYHEQHPASHFQDAQYNELQYGGLHEESHFEEQYEEPQYHDYGGVLEYVDENDGAPAPTDEMAIDENWVDAGPM